MDRSVPPGEIQGELTPPCSKSYAQRALAAALLAEGESTLRNIELCDDTRSAMRCIKALGADVTVVDSHTLKIRGGLAPRGRTLHVGESGLSTRLFTPIAALAGVPLRIEGEGTLLRRPITSPFLQSFLYYVPYVTLSVMTFPAMVDATQSPIAGVAALAMGVFFAYRGASLPKVAALCCGTVLLLELVL